MSTMQPASLPTPLYYGKYRGIVLNNFDPLGLGRIIAEVPAIPNLIPLNWCMPSVPYAGMLVGFYFIPPIGASVWVEFERGDPNYPIWTGCYWVEGQVPPFGYGLPAALNKCLATEFFRLWITDTPAAATFVLNHTADPATIITVTGNPTGLQVAVPPALASMIPETGISLTYPPGNFSMTAAAITTTIPASTITMTSAAVEVTSPSLSVTANTSVTGTVDITGPVTVTGAVSVTGNVDVTGGTSLLGDVAITGQLSVLGPCSLAMP